MTPRSFVVSADQVITGTDSPPLPNGTVVVTDGVIEAIGSGHVSAPRGAREIRLEGATILPGLIDCHEHLVGRGRYAEGIDDLQEPDAVWGVVVAHECISALRRGVTTVRVPGSHNAVDLAVRRALAEGFLIGPRLVCAGEAITITGGHGRGAGVEVDGPSACARAARTQFAAGADFIKVIATGGVGVVHPGEDPTHPEMTVEEIAAVVRVANFARRKVTAHADGEEGIGNALEAGVHCIEHGIYLTPAQADRMARTGTAFVPTLSTMINIAQKGPELGLEPEWSRIAEGILDVHRRSFEAALEAGVTFATGTDGYGDLVDEVKEFTTYGLSPQRALQAATRDAARIADPAANFGTLEIGKVADLIAVDGDPLEDLERLRDVRLVMTQGRLVVEPAGEDRARLSFDLPAHPA